MIPAGVLKIRSRSAKKDNAYQKSKYVSSVGLGMNDSYD